MAQSYPGEKVPVVEVDDPSVRLAWFCPFTEGENPELQRELVWFDPAPTAVRELDPSEVLYGELSEELFS
jgi:hypothetical protein